MRYRGGNFTQRLATAQIGCPGMRLRQGPQKGAVGFGLSVADDDLSLDTAPAQLEGSLDRRIGLPAPPLTSRKPETSPPCGPFSFWAQGFSDASRLSETGRWRQIGLRTPRISFQLLFIQIETHSKLLVFSGACRKLVAPQLKEAWPPSMQTETPEGGLVVRGREKSLVGWATTKSGGTAPATVVDGSQTSHSLQLAVRTEMRDFAVVQRPARTAPQVPGYRQTAPRAGDLSELGAPNE